MTANKLINNYERKVSLETRDCFICRKDTEVVLRNNADFFFVCANHLSDVSFATAIPEPAPEPAKEAASGEKDAKAKGKDATKESEKDSKASTPAIPKNYKLSTAYFRMREERLAKLTKKAPKSNLLSSLPSVPKSAPN